MQKTKKVISFMLIMALLVSVFGVMSASALDGDTIKLKLVTDKAAYAAGETVKVNIEMTDTASPPTLNLAAFRAAITWDDALFDFVSAELVYEVGTGDQAFNDYFYSDYDEFAEKLPVDGVVNIVYGPFVAYPDPLDEEEPIDWITPNQKKDSIGDEIVTITLVAKASLDSENLTSITFEGVGNYSVTDAASGVLNGEGVGRIYPVFIDSASFTVGEDEALETTWDVNEEMAEYMGNIQFGVCDFVDKLWYDETNEANDFLYEGVYEIVTGFIAYLPALYVNDIITVTNGEILMYYPDGTLITDATADDEVYIGTGMVLEIVDLDGATVKKATVVLMGDLDGNGWMDSGDVSLAVSLAVFGNRPVEGVEESYSTEILIDPPCYAIAADVGFEMVSSAGESFITSYAVSALIDMYLGGEEAYVPYYPLGD